MIIKVKLTEKLATPVFVVASKDVTLNKVFGATKIGLDCLWYYPAYYPLHDIVLRDFEALQLAYKLSEMAQAWVDHQDAYAERVQKRELPNSFEFKTKPYEHQLQGLTHIYYNIRAALFYSCGLGKTKIIVDWHRLTKAKPLILCPPVVMPVWVAEMKRHGIEQEIAVVDSKTKTGKLKQIEEAKNYQGLVVSYDTARLYVEELKQPGVYNAIVADESHYIKGAHSQRTKAALELAAGVKRRIVMSGTPSTGDPRDMFAQLKFISPSLVQENFWKFQHKFCIFSQSNRHIVEGFKNLHVLNKRIELVSLKKTKEECLDLPTRNLIDLKVPLYSCQRKFYNTLIASQEYQDVLKSLLEKQSLLTQEGRIDIPNAAVLVNKLLQIVNGFMYLKADVPNICDGCAHIKVCVHEGIRPYTKKCLIDSTPVPVLVEKSPKNAKLDALSNKLEEIFVEDSNKCIVWGQFKTEMDLLEQFFKEKWGENSFVRVDGSTKNPAEAAKRFNEDVNCRIYLGQVETGIGITLNAANYMVYFSLPWKLLAYEQSLDRNHRVGQRRSVTVFRLIGANTVDEHVAINLNQKRSVAATITSVLTCVGCKRNEYCLVNNIRLFEPGCKFKRSVNKSTTRVNPV